MCTPPSPLFSASLLFQMQTNYLHFCTPSKGLDTFFPLYLINVNQNLLSASLSWQHAICYGFLSFFCSCLLSFNVIPYFVYLLIIIICNYYKRFIHLGLIICMNWTEMVPTMLMPLLLLQFLPKQHLAYLRVSFMFCFVFHFSWISKKH